MIRTAYICWGILYVLCAGFGFVPEPSGIVQVCMTLLALIFFVPGFVLLYLGQRKQIRLISAVSLISTMVCIMLSILSVHSTTGTGDFLHALLGLVSAPMYCAGYWLLSLFLWACLLMTSFTKNQDGQ